MVAGGVIVDDLIEEGCGLPEEELGGRPDFGKAGDPVNGDDPDICSEPVVVVEHKDCGDAAGETGECVHDNSRMVGFPVLPVVLLPGLVAMVLDNITENIACIGNVLGGEGHRGVGRLGHIMWRRAAEGTWARRVAEILRVFGGEGRGRAGKVRL